MKIDKFLIKQGEEINVPILDSGEPAFTTDENNFFIGSNNGNIQFAKQNDLKVISDTISNSIIVEQWNNSISYSSNMKKIVMFNNNFYKCNVTDSTIGTFIESEWLIINGSINNTIPSFDGTSSTSTSYEIHTLPTY